MYEEFCALKYIFNVSRKPHLMHTLEKAGDYSYHIIFNSCTLEGLS